MQRVAVDRAAEDTTGVFGERIAALAADAVIDMLCFTPESAQQLLNALRPTRPLLLREHLGSRPGLDLDVWQRLATGEPLPLPDLGPGVLHHVHADDVAQAFEQALARPAAIGSSFHVASEQAMTVRGLAAGVAGWFGREPNIEPVNWPAFEQRVGAEHASVSREHVTRSIAASIERARNVLGYRPRYTSLEALHESLRWLTANDHVQPGEQAL